MSHELEITVPDVFPESWVDADPDSEDGTLTIRQFGSKRRTWKIPFTRAKDEWPFVVESEPATRSIRVEGVWVESPSISRRQLFGFQPWKVWKGDSVRFVVTE